MLPRITIITICYNAASTISRTLRSVQAQTYPHLEYLVIDGASRDTTLELVEELAPRAQVYSEPDRGIYDAMNKGIALATGDIIGILNSDDFYISTDVITSVVNEMQQKDLDAVYGDLEYVDEVTLSRALEGRREI